jgi:hypothetical protein
VRSGVRAVSFPTPLQDTTTHSLFASGDADDVAPTSSGARDDDDDESDDPFAVISGHALHPMLLSLVHAIPPDMVRRARCTATRVTLVCAGGVGRRGGAAAIRVGDVAGAATRREHQVS